MSKSIKHMTYDMVDGERVWRKIRPGEEPRESVCPDCQIQRPKKEIAPESMPEEGGQYAL